MQDFYRAIHAVVGELMYAKNFFIALYDDERQLISWPYFIDEVDLDVPARTSGTRSARATRRGWPHTCFELASPIALVPRLLELIVQGEVELVGSFAEDSSWLGVPLAQRYEVATVEPGTRVPTYPSRG
jgi:hypothetical protein